MKLWHKITIQTIIILVFIMLTVWVFGPEAELIHHAVP